MAKLPRSYRQVVQDRQIERFGQPTSSGEEWRPDEYGEALNLYLEGYGFGTIAGAIHRGVEAVENVLLSDIPRNYRLCINKWVRHATNRGSLRKARWENREQRYLKLLLDNNRSEIEISWVLNRSVNNIIRMTFIIRGAP